jgi:predicted exporter
MLRARWVMLRARWVTLRARWVTLRARWVMLRARWVTLRACLCDVQVAFALGVFSSIPALQGFGIYASLCILFDYVFQFTFFLPCMVRHPVREGCV